MWEASTGAESVGLRPCAYQLPHVLEVTRQIRIIPVSLGLLANRLLLFDQVIYIL